MHIESIECVCVGVSHAYAISDFLLRPFWFLCNGVEHSMHVHIRAHTIFYILRECLGEHAAHTRTKSEKRERIRKTHAAAELAASAFHTNREKGNQPGQGALRILSTKKESDTPVWVNRIRGGCTYLCT